MCLLQKKFKRLKRVIDDDSDEADEGDGRDRIANQIFQGSDVSIYIFFWGILFLKELIIQKY